MRRFRILLAVFIDVWYQAGETCDVAVLKENLDYWEGGLCCRLNLHGM